MSRLYLLDTNTISYIVKGTSAASRAQLEAVESGHVVCVSAVTEAELHYGLAKRGPSPALQAAIENLLRMLQVLPWGRAEAKIYGRLRAQQEAAGKTLGNLDMMIAAHAITVGATLVTSDRAFLQVPDLVAVVNWATDLIEANRNR